MLHPEASETSIGVVISAQEEDAKNNPLTDDNLIAINNVFNAASGSNVTEDNQSFQIVLNNVHKFASGKDVEVFLRSPEISLKFKKVKKIPQKTFAFVTFDSLVDRDAALGKLEGAIFRKLRLNCCIRSHNKRDRDEQSISLSNKKGRAEEFETASRTAKDAVSPWWNVPYREQLARKTENMKAECIIPLLKAIMGSYKGELPQWLAENRQNLLQSILLEDIIESPEPFGYRNKGEFTFGCDSKNREALGFRVSSYPIVRVEPPDEVPNIPIVMKRICRTFIDFLNTDGHSRLKVYDQLNHKGVYRILTVRYSKRTGGLLLMLCVSLKDTDPLVWQAELEQLTDQIKTLKYNPDAPIDEEAPFVHTANPTEGVQLVTGFCLQIYDGVSVPSPDHPVSVVFGDTTITEILLGCRFAVAPQAFFQVNTLAAESLYNRVISNITDDTASSTSTEPSLSHSSCVLDICCGTGTIGICALKNSTYSAHRPLLLGIELCGPAVENARENAKQNEVMTYKDIGSVGVSGSYAEFVCSRAEDVLASLLHTGGGEGKGHPDVAEAVRQIATVLHGKKLLAIVDPPREGMHHECLKAIRNCSRIDRLIYVSCNPIKSLVRDASILCGPSSNRFHGRAFRPVSATPVDLFPHTAHCELIMVFDRIV